jgi:hypothetical protein
VDHGGEADCWLSLLRGLRLARRHDAADEQIGCFVLFVRAFTNLYVP